MYNNVSNWIWNDFENKYKKYHTIVLSITDAIDHDGWKKKWYMGLLMTLGVQDKDNNSCYGVILR